MEILSWWNQIPVKLNTPIQWLIIESLTNWYFSEQGQDLLGIYNAGNGVDFAERIEGDAYAFEKWPY